jgi:intracellular multiplication protein IcmP
MRLIVVFSDRYRTLDSQALALDPASVTARKMYLLCHLVGLFFRIPAAVVSASLAVLCLTRAAPARFTRTLTLDYLMQVQAKVFRTTAAFVGRDLRLVPLGAGAPRPLDPALHVGEWADRYARFGDGSYDESGALRELTAQLGPVWRGPRRAAPHVRCFFAAFALHGMREQQAALALLGDISEALPRENTPQASGPEAPLKVPEAIITRADAILRSDDLARSAEIAARHGFTAPAMMSVLCEARLRGGVLAPAQFNFLKLVDRRLWYALHSLGFPAEAGAPEQPMPNPRVEAIGARDHWAAECQAGRPLHMPQLDRAILAIRVRLSDSDVGHQPKEPT